MSHRPSQKSNRQNLSHICLNTRKHRTRTSHSSTGTPQQRTANEPVAASASPMGAISGAPRGGQSTKNAAFGGGGWL
ncbi:hypothetical protein LMH87_004721 [Akanthomyces muscarius]|uniref:Uncharacterized protein n=1 Tax=Akanthomyces muscarius TaxID=2231603 RepID=A0A9W8UI58_AKAMU|nr:hypothetical protein LMH87_004721 [Akanthomyces muscarius]KAJ4145890.1 hypothetical protein LMH87_004721 [Akanthomyces muscarius]